MKAIIRRPPLHHAIIAGYVLAPFVNIVLLLIFTGLPLGLVMRRLFAGYGTAAALWLLTAPLAGIALYLVSKVSWYVFLAHSALILVDFAVKWIVRPKFYLERIPPLNHALMLAGNLALVAIIGYMINRDFRAPYFQVLRRHWRESTRIPLRHVVTYASEQRQIDDISNGGCFVTGVAPELAVGAVYPLSFRLGQLEVKCSGEIMRVTDRGCGIRFVGLSRPVARRLRETLRRRFSLRYKVDFAVDFAAEWRSGAFTAEGRVANISSGGCYVAIKPGNVEEGARGVLHITEDPFRASIPARVAWVNADAEHGKAPGFGLQFVRSQTALARRIYKAGYRTLTR